METQIYNKKTVFNPAHGEVHQDNILNVDSYFPENTAPPLQRPSY